MLRLHTLLNLGRSRRTETAILFGFAALALVIGLSLWRSAAKLNDFVEASNQSRYYAQVVETLQSVLGNITVAESEQRGYLVTGDTNFLSTYDAALLRVRRGFERLLKLTEHDAKLHPQILDVKQITEKRIEYLGNGIQLYRSADQPRTHEYVKMGTPLRIAARTRFAQVQSEYQTALDETLKQTLELRSDAVQSSVFTSTLAAIVLAFMGLMVIIEARFIRALSERLLHDSRHDVLTQLPNRGYVNESLARAIAAAKRANEKLAVLYMDLNGFKQVNDTLGHKAGDDLLVEVSRNLERMARDSDFVARLGGDEFVVVMPRVTDASQVEAAAQRFSGLAVKQGALTVGASVGSAIYPDDAESAEALMQVGDAAMYERKQAARRG